MASDLGIAVGLRNSVPAGHLNACEKVGRISRLGCTTGRLDAELRDFIPEAVGQRFDGKLLAP